MNTKIMMVGIALLGWPLAASAQAGAEGSIDARAGTEVRAEGSRSPAPRGNAEGTHRASSREVDRAASSLDARLEASAGALGSAGRKRRAATRAEIEAGAEALARGARSGDLRKLRESAPDDRSLETSLHALARLTASGMDPAAATARVAGRLRAGASDAAIARLTAGGAARAPRTDAAATAGAAAGVGIGLGGVRGSLMGGLRAGAGLGSIR